jgi:RNB domain
MLWAEVVVNGETRVARVTAVRRNGSLPKLEITYYSHTDDNNISNSSTGILEESLVNTTIDLGQVTTVWNDTQQPALLDWSSPIPLDSLVLDQNVEVALDTLYQGRIGRVQTFQRGQSGAVAATALTKKQITLAVQAAAESYRGSDGSLKQHMETVLRQLCKTGPGFGRLVDSNDLAHFLGDAGVCPSQPSSRFSQGRAQAAGLLARDSAAGGRFKRWPCLFLHDENDTIVFVNGGWLVTDRSVRAGSEARKFVERGLRATQTAAAAAGTTTAPMDHSPTAINHRFSSSWADARIVRRLECLAMGELTVPTTTVRAAAVADLAGPKGSSKADHTWLELDVRETLKAMGLPPSPDGAKRALVQTGHWSQNAADQLDRLSSTLQPWSADILQAANWYARNYTASARTDQKSPPTESTSYYSMVDLRRWPCVSVDAARATFRDDALGVRHRAATGRAVVPAASQWEILIHIADVSDVYVEPSPPSHNYGADPAVKIRYLSQLRAAAESRGSSRYDLPLGPLHLLPPVVLRSLAFPDANDTAWAGCRAVTLWAYIDERNGRLLDAGIERTLTSVPIQLSFGEAASVMEGKGSKEMEKARAILLVVERNVNKWQKYNRQRNAAAQKRESRLSAREHLSGSTVDIKGSRDDGADGFQRTRGHRLVDATLDLYSIASSSLLRKAGAALPRAIGADASRGGRFATAPLRRYIDGQAQRQLLAVCCNYGQRMSLDECKEVSKLANKAVNAINNVRSIRSRRLS